MPRTFSFQVSEQEYRLIERTMDKVGITKMSEFVMESVLGTAMMVAQAEKGFHIPAVLNPSEGKVVAIEKPDLSKVREYVDRQDDIIPFESIMV